MATLRSAACATALLLCFLAEAQQQGGYPKDFFAQDGPVMKDNKEKGLRGFWTAVKAEDGKQAVPVYLSMPRDSKRKKRPAVIIAHHAVGIFNHGFLRQFADDLTDHGFVTILPDFFVRVWNSTVPHGLGIPESEMNIKAMLASQVDVMFKEDLKTILRGFTQDPSIDKDRVAVLGFCMGGRIAWLAATEPELKGKIHAAVSYHGGNVFEGMGSYEAYAPASMIKKHMHCPMLGHFAELDQNPSKEDMEQLQILAGDKLQAKVYAKTRHGFSCKDSAKYSEEAASEALEETVKFLKKNLANEKEEL